MNRRDFLERGIYSLLSLLGLGFLIPALVSLFPSVIRERRVEYIPVLKEDEAPLSTIKKVDLNYKIGVKEYRSKAFLIPTEKGLLALSPVCSHFGCLVNFRRDKKEFLCPCHGGRYNVYGKNLSGPPPKPLSQFPILIKDGHIYLGIKV